MGLSHSLSARAKHESVWYSRGQWRNAQELSTRANAWAAQIKERHIALAFADNESLAVGMLAVESRCDSVLLVPSSWDQNTFDKYAQKAGVALLVTDRTDLQAAHRIRPGDTNPDTSDAFAASPAQTRWIIPTSGTTGEPKLVEHRFTSLTRTVKTDAAKGKELVWGLLYELARFAGLQVFLQALLGGSRLVFTDRSAGIEATVAQLIGADCNALSATPTLWRRLMMCENTDRLSLRLATLGGEIADQAILTLLNARFPKARVFHIYASTEAGVGFSVNDGRAGFPSAFLENPPAGIELRVDGEGMLWLRSAAAQQRFLDETRRLADADGWIETGDQVHREGDRCIFLGRANGTINVGGNKVFPEEVENCIRSVKGVVLASVRARANPIMGSLVEALVKPAPDADRPELKRAIAAACRASLSPYKIPALVTWVEDINMNAAGKLVRS